MLTHGEGKDGVREATVAAPESGNSYKTISKLLGHSEEKRIICIQDNC